MDRSLSRFLWVLCIFALAGGFASAQKGGGGGAASAGQAGASAQMPSASSAGASPTAGPAASSLQGISFPKDSWPQISFLPAPESYAIKNKTVANVLDEVFKNKSAAANIADNFAVENFINNVVIYCFTLEQNDSASIPFLLVPTSYQDTDPIDLKVGKNRNLCSNQSKSMHNAPSVVMGKFLIFRIDMGGIPRAVRDRIQTLNINVSSQTGSSFNSQRGPTINPNTALPSMSLLSGQKFKGCNDHDGNKPPDFFDQYRLGGEYIGDAFCNTDSDVFYLAWPAPLVGDSIPTVSINLVYTPVASALQWKPGTFYPAGAIVAPNNTSGHYYLALNGGISSDRYPQFDTHVTKLMIFSDLPGSTGLSWQDMGLAPPSSSPGAWVASETYGVGELVIPPAGALTGHYYQAIQSGTANKTAPAFTANAGQLFSDGGASTLVWKDMGLLTSLNPVPTVWTPNTGYAMGALITTGAQPSPTSPNGPQAPSNGHYYKAISPGVSGPNAPAFPVDGSSVSESDGVKYVDSGMTPPANGKLKAWMPKTAYFLGDTILDTTTGHYYTVVQAGISGSGPNPPAFSVPIPEIAPKDGDQAADQPPDQPIDWQDLGSTLPASDSVGTQPSDQVVSLLNLTYPQVHVLSRFNLSSGVLITTLKPPAIATFAESNSQSATNCPTGLSTCTYYTSAGGGRLVDPVLGITLYLFRPLDAERPFTRGDLTPSPSFYISLTSPTTNYHVGFASEFFFRNLQLVYGASIVQETRVTGAQAMLTIAPVPPSTTPTYMPVTIGGQSAFLSTTKVSNAGGFIGFTFNITGFIQSLIP